MTTRSERLLLTGSRGFTGRHLSRLLREAGYGVIGLIDDGVPAADERVADLTDASAVSRVVAEVSPDVVVHLAAISFAAHDDVACMYRTNTDGTRHLLEALRQLDRMPRRVVLASSAQVYGQPDPGVVRESAPLRPLNHYGASKAAMEAVVSVYRQELPCIVTRPFNYTGPGQATHFLVPKLVDHFARRAPRIELGNLDVERDFLDVRDVAGLYAALVDCEPVAGAVNLCSGQGTTLREIVARLERITGHVMDMQVNPQFVRSREIPSLVGSDERLRALLGDAPRIGLDTTLRDMLDAARAVH
jgi:nucleoside-diphosphate-sugar epimerase